jgi:hypothetical protein
MVRALGIAGMLVVVAATAAAGQGDRVTTPALVELGWTGIVGSWTPSGFVLDRIRPRSPAARCGLLRLEPGCVTRILTLDGAPLTPETAGLLAARASASLAIATGPAEEDEELVLGPCVLERTRSARRELLAWPEPSLPPAPRWRAVSGTPAPRNMGTRADQAPVGEALLP